MKVKQRQITIEAVKMTNDVIEYIKHMVESNVKPENEYYPEWFNSVVNKSRHQLLLYSGGITWSDKYDYMYMILYRNKTKNRYFNEDWYMFIDVDNNINVLSEIDFKKRFSV